MDAAYVFLCGIMWCRYRLEDAGWELVNALGSSDSKLRFLAGSICEKAEQVARPVSR
jgi:hypothetical protein